MNVDVRCVNIDPDPAGSTRITLTSVGGGNI